MVFWLNAEPPAGASGAGISYSNVSLPSAQKLLIANNYFDLCTIKIGGLVSVSYGSIQNVCSHNL